MSNVSVYSFADATGLTQYVDSVGDFQFTGTWSSTGTYFASPLTAAQYGVGLYMCIRDNVGDNPQRVPTRTRPASWSIMSLLYEYQSGSVSPTDALAQAAYDLAVSGTNIAWAAYYLAQIGTNTGSAAYNLAGSAIGVANNALSVANGAFSIAVAGTNAAASALSTASSAFSIAVIGTNVGSEALSIASAAYALAQIGTNTGTAALQSAAVAQYTANSAFSIAVTGTNAAATAKSTADAAYALAQIGTNTGTAALNIATSGSSVAWQAYLIAVAGSNNATDGALALAAWELAQIGTNTGSTAYSVAQTAYSIAQIGTNTGSTAYSVAQAAWALAQIGTNTGSTAYSVAQAAYALAQIGTASGGSGGTRDGVSTIAWAGTIFVDFSGSTYQKVTLLGSTYFTGINYAAGSSVSVEITGTADTNISFDPSWKQLGNFASAISSGATGWIGLVSIGTTATNVDAAYAATDFLVGTLSQDLTAYRLAQIGTNVGSTAYSTAQAAYALAQIGTTAVPTYGSVSTSTAINGTMYYDFNSYTYQETTVGTHIWISGTHMAAARELVVILVPDGTTHNLGFDAFKFFGTTAPTSISTQEIMISFVCKDGTLANTRTAWIQQA